MKISQLIEFLIVKEKLHGDIETRILDDESGYFEPVFGGYYVATTYGEESLDLVTERQASND